MKFGQLIFITHLCVVLNMKVDKVSSLKTKKTIKTKRCRYVFVVKEMDTSSCPNEITSQRPIDNEVITEDFRNDMHPRKPLFKGGSNDIEDLNNRLQNMEQELDHEKQKNSNLNVTISKQEMTLQNMYRFINNMKIDQHKQKQKYNELEKKFIGMELDVAEVNNVLTKRGTLSEVSTGETQKEIPVQSAAKTHSCAMTNPDTTFQDCQEVYEKGYKISGIYHITPLYSSCSIPVWCDMDTPPGGWLVIQKRFNGKVDFNWFWKEYREGFGNIASEYWIGLDNMFLLTNQGHYELRIDLWDFEDNKVYASYESFKIDGERDQYRLEVRGFKGSARDSLLHHNNMKFSTVDSDNDKYPNYSCAREWQCGWWFNACYYTILNGKYSNISNPSDRTIAWNEWKPKQLAKTEMKIRPSRTYKNHKRRG